jgi:hypothetical protein
MSDLSMRACDLQALRAPDLILTHAAALLNIALAACLTELSGGPQGAVCYTWSIFVAGPASFVAE